MSVTELKEKIHAAVDSVEDVSHLHAVLTLLRLPFRIDEEELREEELKILNERDEAYRRGEMELIPWNESLARIKQKHGF